MATPGPYDDAIAAIGVQINALTEDLKTLRAGHAAKSDLDTLRADLTEARSELKALREKKAEIAKPPKSKEKDPLTHDEIPPDPDAHFAGFWS